MNRVEQSVALFQDGHACSQAMLLPWARALGLDTALAAKLAAGLGGGMHQGGACGAFSGAVLVLGLAIGGENCVTKAGRDKIYIAVEELAERFRQSTGALDCPQIIGCDIRTPEGLAMALAEDRVARLCVPAVRAAAELLDEILARNGGQGPAAA